MNQMQQQQQQHNKWLLHTKQNKTQMHWHWKLNGHIINSRVNILFIISKVKEGTNIDALKIKRRRKRIVKSSIRQEKKKRVQSAVFTMSVAIRVGHIFFLHKWM